MQLLVSCALDGNITDDERAKLSAHLADCVPCRMRSNQMKVTDKLFRKLDTHVAPPAFVQQVMAKVRQEAVASGDIQDFIRLVAKNPTLQDQIRPATSPDAFIALFVSLGQQQGYRFDSGEIISLLAANDDLSDEQLDAVVGGVNRADAGLHAFIDGLFPDGFK
jgi:predicted ribosomally synthesized peptide with nif11-like leader